MCLITGKGLGILQSDDIMQTVITWRRPIDEYPAAPNPCLSLLGNALCYIVTGLILLVVGVIITSLTFQNLHDYKKNQERYAGPVLIAAGILLIAKGAFTKLHPGQRELDRRRSFLRRYIREIYNMPIFAAYRSSTIGLCGSSEQLQDIHIAPGARTRLYSDDPPPYDVVTCQDSPHEDEEETSFTEVPEDDESAVFDQGVGDTIEMPPSYEEFMKGAGAKL